MNPKQKIIVLAHARSGSNSLMDALNKHPKIDLLREPFNESRPNWKKGLKNYKKELKDSKSLNKILQKIFKKHNGFKTLVYQIPKKYGKNLFSRRGMKVIVLYRKNKLKSAVSLEIAKQTRAWHVKDRSKAKSKNIGHLNIDNLRNFIRFTKESMQERADLLERLNVPYMEVSYEEIHEAKRSKRLRKVKEIFEFLGYEIPDEKEMEEIDKVLSPQEKNSEKRPIHEDTKHQGSGEEFRFKRKRTSFLFCQISFINFPELIFKWS
ncbi:MAG: Stf0 family sulfotransferase [Candidatus Pacearchaeota archaeon]